MSTNILARTALMMAALACSFVSFADNHIRYGITDEDREAQASYKKPYFMQVMIGQSKLDDDTLDLDAADERFDGDWDGNLNYFGGGVQSPIWGDRFALGWEGGAYMSWKTEDVNFYVRSSGGTTARFQVDTSFYGLETYLGIYTSMQPIDRVRFYVGAGPLIQMAYVELEDDDDEVENVVVLNGSSVRIQLEDTDFDADLGWYARAGLEFKVSKTLFVGLVGRYVRAELDMSDSMGEVSLDGTLAMLSFGTKL